MTINVRVVICGVVMPTLPASIFLVIVLVIVLVVLTYVLIDSVSPPATRESSRLFTYDGPNTCCPSTAMTSARDTGG